MFAKLYGPDDDQVLVLNTEDDEGNPAVQITIQPEGLGLSSVFLSFNDRDAADRVFEKIDEGTAFLMKADLEAQIAQTGLAG